MLSLIGLFAIAFVIAPKASIIASVLGDDGGVVAGDDPTDDVGESVVRPSSRSPSILR